MDGLILLVILVPLVYLILLITILSRTGEQRQLLESLYDELRQLRKQVNELNKVPNEEKPSQDTTVKKETIVQEKPLIPLQKTAITRPQPEKPLRTPPPVPVEPKKIQEEKKEEPVKFSKQAPVPVELETHLVSNHRDLEKFIGENLANKIGIAVLVLGIAFFVKYAIDKNWINEAGRVLIGLACGTILIGLAHYFRNSYRSFSSVLVGGGLSVFYFSIAFAFHQYHLVGQTTAFISMVLISGLGVVLSLYYNRQELAILATIGGFITPFLVSTGQDNYRALFTYLCILNSGLMALSWFKRWPAINSIALFFTTIIYGGWLANRTLLSGSGELPVKDALLFATLFFLLFVAMHILNVIRLKTRFGAFDFILVLSTHFLYYIAGMVILNNWENTDYKGLFTALLGLFNLLLAFIFYRKKNVDPNFVSLLIGLSLTFISLTAPVQFEGNHIVLFWAAEAPLLLWLYQRSRIDLIKIASLLVLLLMLVSLFINWTSVYFSDTISRPIIFNKGCITALVASLAFFLYRVLVGKEKEILFIRDISVPAIKRIVQIAGIACLYLAGVLEIWYQFNIRYTTTPVHIIYLQAFTIVFVIILLRVFRADVQFPVLKFLLTAFIAGLYLMHIGTQYEIAVSLFRMDKGFLFAVHWLVAGLLLWQLYTLIIFFFRQKNRQWSVYAAPFTWIAVISILIVLSAELYQLMLWTNYRDNADWAWWENLYYKAGLSILWGLCSFAMMWLGMKKNFRPLRIISLFLFTITIIKLFTYDIRNIPPGGKIAAFILLGILLLAVSFMYQRLKKILIDNTAE